MMGEQDVREQLQAVAVPPTGLRVEALVAGGRRRAFRRRAAQTGCGVALASALLVGVPAVMMRPGGGQSPDQPAAAPTAEASASASGPRQATANPKLPTVQCAGTSLPIPAGMTAVQPVGVDPSGTYVLGNDLHSSEKTTKEGKVAGVGASRPILWANGQPQVLPTVRNWVSGSAVNASGVVAAVAGPKDKWADTVVRYTGGVPEKLVPPAGKWEFQRAFINAAGDIAVDAQRPGTSYAPDAVLLWKAGAKTATKLPLPANANAVSLLDDGTIVGSIVSNEGSRTTSYAWDQRGLGQALQAPAGQEASVSNAHGDWATGNLWPSGEVARWNLRTGEVTQLPVGSPANAINAAGAIASNGTVLRNDANVVLGLAGQLRGDPLAISDTGLVAGLPFDGSSGVITWRCSS